MSQKVLILLKNLDTQTQKIQAVADFLSSWSKVITAGGFVWSFEIQKTDSDFPVLDSIVTQGTDNVKIPGRFIDPASIVAAASKPCDIVALLYNNLEYQNTISVHNPFLQNGVTCIQLPISVQSNIEGISETLAHELLHACYFLANQRGANLVDDVHQHSGLSDPRPDASFANILLKLQPYWPLLTRQETLSRLAILQLKAIELLKQWRDALKAKAVRKPRITEWAEAIKEFEGYYEGSVSFRNNNPGNLKFAYQKGAIGKDEQGHAIFKTYEDGWNALIRQLTLAATGMSAAYKATMTLREFFAKYAEANQEQYAQFIAEKLGVPTDTKIKTLL